MRSVSAAISSWMQRVGVGWLAWELTQSPVWLGVIAAADLVPILLLSPMAGVFTDRSSPMKILLVTQWLQFVQAALLAGFMFIGVLNIEMLFGLTLALGFIHAFATAARHAVVPNTVPKELVGTAVSLDSALFQASRFIGPSRETALNHTYPLTRFLFIAVNKTPGQPAPELVREWFHYVFSEEGGRRIEQSGFYMLPANTRATEEAALR